MVVIVSEGQIMPWQNFASHFKLRIFTRGEFRPASTFGLLLECLVCSIAVRAYVMNRVIDFTGHKNL